MQTEPRLQLDDRSLDPSQLSISTLTREIGLKTRPNWLLFKMMNVLEKKRQAKGYGWSRAWNKYGVNVFRSHTASMCDDTDYFAPVAPFLRDFVGPLESPYGAFIPSLLEDPACMTFTFYHNHTSDAGQHEGLTFSFGRKVPEDKTKRDRLDIIVEDKREDGSVDGHVDRVRIYVCPWETYATKTFYSLEVTELTQAQRSLAQSLYDHGVAHYHTWKEEPARQWSHWSTRYIEYFGPRAFIPKQSAFT